VSVPVPDLTRRGTVTIGPFSLFNREMRLPGHKHFPLLTLHYVTVPGNLGFPAFADTYAAVQRHLMSLTARPFGT
jgi:hypothetical protein